MVLPNPTSRPLAWFAFVNVRSLLTPCRIALRSGDWTWCEYDRWKSVWSVMGNDTPMRGLTAVCASPGVKTFDTEAWYRASGDVEFSAGFQFGSENTNPGVSGKRASLLK